MPTHNGPCWWPMKTANANFSHFNVIHSKFHAQNQSYHLQKALFQTVFKRFCS